MRKLIFIISLMTISVVSYSQSSRAYARQGNGAYEKGKMDEADLYYRKSLEAKDNDKVNEALYNLGNALYKKEDYEHAATQFENYVNTEGVSDAQKAQAYHNLGNAYYKQQNYGKSVEAYKKSLKLNSTDDETRYNLAKAQRMLIQQQQQQQQQQQNQNQNQNQNQQQEQQQQQEQKDQISDETMEQIMNAISQEDEQVREKAQQNKPQKKNLEKDW